MCALVSDEEPDAISRFNLDEDPDDDLPRRSYWWSLHRPETYALAAFALAVVTLMSLGGAQEIYQTIILVIRPQDSGRVALFALAGIRLAVAILAIIAAVVSIRSEDEDTTWSPPVARAAILVAVVSALLSAASLIVTAAASDPNNDQGF